MGTFHLFRRSTNHYVAVIGVRPDLRPLTGLPRSGTCTQGVAHSAAACGRVEPRCGTFRDTDLELTGCGRELDRAADNLIDSDVAARRIRHDHTTHTAD